MKGRKIYTVIAYFLLLFAVILMLVSCRTKKSTLQQNLLEKENVSLIDKSQEQKIERGYETEMRSSRESLNEKAFSEMGMSFESDKITVTAPDGTKTEITNPRYNKSAIQNTEATKDKQSVVDSSKVSETTRKRQTDVKADAGKESTSELKTYDERKSKAPWAYFFGAAAMVVLCWILIKSFKK